MQISTAGRTPNISRIIKFGANKIVKIITDCKNISHCLDLNSLLEAHH